MARRMSHFLNPPATAEKIKRAELALGLPIPESYREVLRIFNGGKLFAVPQVWLQDTFPNVSHDHYHLLGTEELVERNLLLFANFRDACLAMMSIFETFKD